MKKQFIEEQALLEDAFRLAVNIFDSGFRPDFIVGIWRGGSTVGIYVQECLQYLGVKTDHIAIRTSYRGQPSYGELIENPESIRVHGLQYLFENLNREDKLLIVDDVFSSGYNVEAVINRLTRKCKRNMPEEVRVQYRTSSQSRTSAAANPTISFTPPRTGWCCPTNCRVIYEEIAEYKPDVAPPSAKRCRR